MDPDFHPSITPYPNGPYYVNDVSSFANRRGPIRTRPTMVLCRCGASATTPYCDGTHVKIGFSSAKLERPVENRRDNYTGREVTIHDNRAICSHAGLCMNGLPSVKGNVAIFVAPNGPYVVTGGPELRNTIREEGASMERFALCRCGGSRNKPFCDGSHARIGFKDDRN